MFRTTTQSRFRDLILKTTRDGEVEMDVLRLHVLLVNEDPNLLDTMAECLEAQGFTTVKVATHDEAIKAIAHETFQVIITDLTMPDDDGVHLSKELGTRMPIVLLKANEDERSTQGLDNFCCCFLDKSEIRGRLAQAAWTAFKRFKIDQKLTKEMVAA